MRKPKANIKRVKAIFKGAVHGVGFRFTAIHLSRKYEITGYVKNMDDGSVEVVAEGDESILIEFIDSIKTSQVRNYIKAAEIDYCEPTGQFECFDIAY